MALVGYMVPVGNCAGGLCKASRVLCWWVRVRGRRGVTGGQKGAHGSCPPARGSHLLQDVHPLPPSACLVASLPKVQTKLERYGVSRSDSVVDLGAGV